MKDITLYFAPHQDDELLSMGIGVINSIKDSDTHIILCSDGSKSNIRNVLNNKRFCKHHFSFHRYKLSVNEFVNARDMEFINSCKSLGVSDCNIHIDDDRTIDGSLSIKKAREIIIKYLDKYENAKVRTITPFGCDSQHMDHKNLGYAAIELYNEGKIKDLKFYIEPYFYKEFVDVNPNIEIMSMGVENKEEYKLLNALNAYKVWKPKYGRYCIGYHSTKPYFDQLTKEKICYFHVYK